MLNYDSVATNPRNDARNIKGAEKIRNEGIDERRRDGETMKDDDER